MCAHPVTDPVSGNHVLFSFCLQLSLTAWSIVLFGWKLHLPGLITELTIRELNEVTCVLLSLIIKSPGLQMSAHGQNFYNFLHGAACECKAATVSIDSMMSTLILLERRYVVLPADHRSSIRKGCEFLSTLFMFM